MYILLSKIHDYILAKKKIHDYIVAFWQERDVKRENYANSKYRV